MQKLALPLALIVFGLCLGGQQVSAEEELAMEPTAKINYFYIVCNNIDEMRTFYSETLGMKEVFYNPAPEGWLGYNFDGVEFMVFQASNPVPVREAWTSQPGWAGGELEVPSWSVKIPEERYRDVVAALKSLGVPTWADKPMWLLDNYWGFPVRDPMGNTVEVFTIPAEKPATREWSE